MPATLEKPIFERKSQSLVKQDGWDPDIDPNAYIKGGDYAVKVSQYFFEKSQDRKFVTEHVFHLIGCVIAITRCHEHFVYYGTPDIAVKIADLMKFVIASPDDDPSPCSPKEMLKHYNSILKDCVTSSPKQLELAGYEITSPNENDKLTQNFIENFRKRIKPLLEEWKKDSRPTL